MRPDDMLETFSELAVKEPDLMRLVLQASVAALVNVQTVEAVEAAGGDGELMVVRSPTALLRLTRPVRTRVPGGAGRASA